VDLGHFPLNPYAQHDLARLAQPIGQFTEGALVEDLVDGSELNVLRHRQSRRHRFQK
jgi:hypothetical protein|tara:strand:- start:1829 stop:1999 length:171 start_codon:yes stop_codon:yes gene_type:complete